MKPIKIYSVLLLLIALLLAGCSTDSLIEQGTQMLDKLLAGDSDSPRVSVIPDPSQTSPDLAQDVPDGDSYPDPEEPTPPSEELPSSPAEVPASPSETTAASEITPSHTDITFFGPGEFIKYLPSGIDGAYACTYTTDDEEIASVDQDTGKVTAVGPGTTKVHMHVEYNGQYDFDCIVRCNWEASDDDLGDEPTLPDESAQPTLPAADTTSAGASGVITASHYDATFFNPKEHFSFLPVGASADCTCTYTTDDAGIATVSDSGIVTAVSPGTTTVTMTVDAGGSEYIFKCIVRCSWDAETST